MTRFSLSPEELVTDVHRQTNRDAAHQMEKPGSVSVNSAIRITQLNAQNPLNHQRFEIRQLFVRTGTDFKFLILSFKVF